MSNDYYNELSVSGNENQVKQVKDLILDGGQVNFNIVKPMPEILMAETSNLMQMLIYKAKTDDALKIMPYKESRISKLPPKEFVKAYGELLIEAKAIKENAGAANYFYGLRIDQFHEQALLKDILALDGFNEATPVEQSLMKLMDSPDAVKQYQFHSAVKQMTQAFDVDLAIEAFKNCGYFYAGSWAKANWSTPSSALYSRIDSNNDTDFSVSFTTLHYHASEWFESLCDLIEEKELDSIELSYCYGESGAMFAACKDFNLEVGICYREMDDDEVIEFLAIEEDECD